MAEMKPPVGAKTRWNALYSALKPETKVIFDKFLQIRGKIGKGEIRILEWLMYKPSTIKTKVLEEYLADTDQVTIKNAQCGSGNFMRHFYSLEEKIGRQEFFREFDMEPLHRGIYHPDYRVDGPVHRKSPFAHK